MIFIAQHCGVLSSDWPGDVDSNALVRIHYCFCSNNMEEHVIKFSVTSLKYFV